MFPLAIKIGALLNGISSREGACFPLDLPPPTFIEVAIIFFFLSSNVAILGSAADISPVIFFPS